MTTQNYQKNLPDRKVTDMHHDPNVLARLASFQQIIPAIPDVTTFSASGMDFRVIMLQRECLSATGDQNDVQALKDGFSVLNTLVAIGISDGKAYAIWEFYSNGDEKPYRGKGIEVETNHQKRGIGSAFCSAVKAKGYDIKPSGSQTAAGAALLNRLNKSELP